MGDPDQGATGALVGLKLGATEGTCVRSTLCTTSIVITLTSASLKRSPPLIFFKRDMAGPDGIRSTSSVEVLAKLTLEMLMSLTAL